MMLVTVEILQFATWNLPFDMNTMKSLLYLINDLLSLSCNSGAYLPIRKYAVASTSFFQQQKSILKN